jgi:hypothetical protein
VTTVRTAAPLEPWKLAALVLHVCLLCHKAMVLGGEMSVAHVYLIPVHNAQTKMLSIPAVT